MKQLFYILLVIGAVLAIPLVSHAQTNTAPALSQAQVQQVNAFVDGLLPLIPERDIPIAGKIIGYLGLLAVAGRFLKAYLVTGNFGDALWHFVAGIFFNHTPTPPDQSQMSQGAGASKLRGGSGLPLLLAMLLPVLMFAAPCHAQTNAPAVIVTNSVLHDLSLTAQDFATYIKLMPFTTNSAVTLRLGAGENTSTHELVEAATLTVPISANAGVGIIGAHLGNEWLEGGLSLSFGTTNTLPVLGDVAMFAGDGVVYDFITRAPANYAFAGMEKDWVISPKLNFGIGGVTANTSTRSGVDLLGGFHFTFKL